MKILWLLFGIGATSVLGMAYVKVLPLLTVGSFSLLFYMLWGDRKKGFNPKSKTYKELEKIKKDRLKKEKIQFIYINDQITYVAEMWGYTKEQEKIVDKFIALRAYTQIYNKITVTLFPQLITLIDSCNKKGQKGCKREVSKRLRELTDVMKEELQKIKLETKESYETTLEVYDQLIDEMKPR